MTVPQQTQFSPAVQQKHLVKSIAKARVPTALTSSDYHSERTTTPLPHLPTKHEKPSHATPISLAQTNGYESEKSDTHQSTIAEREKKFNAYRLVDIIPTKPKHCLGSGSPKKAMLDLFLQKCFRESQPGKHLHRCIGVGCNVTFSN